MINSEVTRKETERKQEAIFMFSVKNAGFSLWLNFIIGLLKRLQKSAKKVKGYRRTITLPCCLISLPLLSVAVTIQ